MVTGPAASVKRGGLGRRQQEGRRSAGGQPTARGSERALPGAALPRSSERCVSPVGEAWSGSERREAAMHARRSSETGRERRATAMFARHRLSPWKGDRPRLAVLLGSLLLALAASPAADRKSTRLN